MSDNRIAVIGGGVVGITTALVLELRGYDTRVYTKHVPYDNGPHDQPHGLASNYAAASVKPSSIEGEIGTLFAESRRVFAALCDAGTEGVVRHSHYVVSESPVDDPAYGTADTVSRIRSLPERKRDRVPRLTDDVAGWVSEVHVVEMPYYLPRLYDLYRAVGGAVERREVDTAGISELDAAAAVNCTGYWSRELFGDDGMVALRGHLVFADTPGPVRHPDAGAFSYSYAASRTVPPSLEGEVYAYPRVDALVLGGSWERGTPAPEGEWNGDAGADETVEIDGVDVPRRIVAVNRELLQTTVGVDVDEFPLRADYGYRPYRPDGVRIEWADGYGTPVLHNYGHGGSGVALSWGSALRAADRLAEAVKPDGGETGSIEGRYAVLDLLGELVREPAAEGGRRDQDSSSK